MINIYIETSLKPLKRQDGEVGFVIENGLNKGQTATQFGQICEKTEYASVLLGLKYALKRVIKKNEITIWTDCTYVAAGFNKGWLDTWKKNGWKTAKGCDIANKELWQDIAELLDGNTPEVRLKEKHEFKNWLKDEVEKRSKKK